LLSKTINYTFDPFKYHNVYLEENGKRTTKSRRDKNMMG
jgi:hypothetical protein